MRLLDACLGVSLLALGGLAATAAYRGATLPRLKPVPGNRAEEILGDGMLSVVIPAHNEEEGIALCVEAALDSTPLGPDRMEVLVVDDRSTDGTLAVLRGLEAYRQDPRLRIVEGAPVPEGQVVFGKDWACEQGFRAARGSHLLFVDADFFCRPGLVEAALDRLDRDRSGLLGLYPRKVLKVPCEWMVEPLISVLHLAHPLVGATPDPAQPGAFTPGWFMLFRREAYEAIGGHLASGGEILEDLAMGEKTKAAGFRISYCLAPDMADMRMYDSWDEMYEGYTKNFFCAAEHRVDLAAANSGLLAALFVAPWAGLGAAAVSGRPLPVALATAGIGAHLLLRLLAQRHLGIPANDWWSTPVGGALMVYLNAMSAVRNLEGTVTWKGQVLQEGRR